VTANAPARPTIMPTAVSTPALAEHQPDHVNAYVRELRPSNEGGCGSTFGISGVVLRSTR
jgi:hypothetical protein